MYQVATSSSYYPSPTDVTFLQNTSTSTSVDIIEMEAYLAQDFNLPFLALKIVSTSYAYPNDPVIPFPNLASNLASATTNVIENLEFPLEDD